MHGTNPCNHELPDQSAVAKPYCSLGAGSLASYLWKTGDEISGFGYQFNVFRQDKRGRVSQRFRPADIVKMIKLMRVMAAVIADDGCLFDGEQSELNHLAAELDQLLSRVSKRSNKP